MQKFTKLVTKLLPSLALLTPVAVRAQDFNYDYKVSTGTAAGIGIVALIFILIGGTLALISLVFWIMMLIHASSNEIDDKAVWLVVIIVGGIVGALVYYFVVKKPLDSKAKSISPKSKSKK